MFLFVSSCFFLVAKQHVFGYIPQHHLSLSFHRQVISSRNLKKKLKWRGYLQHSSDLSLPTYTPCARASMLLSNERACSRIALFKRNQQHPNFWLAGRGHLTLYKSRQLWTRQRTYHRIHLFINCTYSGTSYPFSAWEIQGVTWEHVKRLKCMSLTVNAWDLRALHSADLRV